MERTSNIYNDLANLVMVNISILTIIDKNFNNNNNKNGIEKEINRETNIRQHQPK